MNPLEASAVRPPVGRPLILGSDPLASLRARGAAVSSHASVGRLLRESPRVVAELHEQEVALGVDVVRAITAATTPRALATIGMAFRAAALTGTAVELASEAAATAARRVAVAGILGHTAAPPMPDRIAEDYSLHADRLATAGCEILVACGFEPAQAASVPPALARCARHAAVVSAHARQLTTWALVELDDPGCTRDGEACEEVARAALEDGADALLFQVASAELGLNVLRRLEGVADEAQVGLLLSADAAERDAAGRAEVLDAWVGSALRLIDAGARMLGGGTGTTLTHLGALAKVLRSSQRAPLLRRAL